MNPSSRIWHLRLARPRLHRPSAHRYRYRLRRGDVAGLDGNLEWPSQTAGREAVAVDDPLDRHDPFDERFGPWGAAGDVDVYGHELVDSLDGGVGVEDSAGAGAGAHADDPLGFGHLLVDVLEDGHHFDADPAGDDHEITLPGAETHRLGAESGQVVAGAGGGHQLDAAAGGGEGHGPEGASARPVHQLLELGRHDIIGKSLGVHRNSCQWTVASGQ